MGRHESARPQGAWAQDFAFVWGLTFALHMQLGKVLRKEFAKLLGRPFERLSCVISIIAFCQFIFFASLAASIFSFCFNLSDARSNRHLATGNQPFICSISTFQEPAAGRPGRLGLPLSLDPGRFRPGREPARPIFLGVFGVGEYRAI